MNICPEDMVQKLDKAFLRYKGMSPHNNPAESDVRDTMVLRRNVRHKLMTGTGLHVFLVLMIYTRTCQKRGIVPWKGIGELSKNPDWTYLGNLPLCQG